MLWQLHYFSRRNGVFVSNGVEFGVYFDYLSQQLVPACALSIEIPVGVVGDVDGRERIARRSVFDRELIFIRELVNGVDLQIPRVALFSVRTMSLQMNSARCHLFSFPHFNVERIFNSSVQVVVASVGM